MHRHDVPAWREPFERALDADMTDQGVRADLADHMEEWGDPACAAVRWLAAQNRYPSTARLVDGRRAFDWWISSSARNSRLPVEVWAALDCRALATNYSRFDAEQDFCRAYPLALRLGWDGGPPVADDVGNDDAVGVVVPHNARRGVGNLARRLSDLREQDAEEELRRTLRLMDEERIWRAARADFV